MKAIIFAEGNGYGHAARDKLLSEHFEIPIITFGKGAEYCRKNRMNFIEIPAPYFIESSKEKVKIVADVADLLRYLKPESTEALKEHFGKADFVIVDGSPLGVALAMLMRKKSIFITNDTAALVGVQGMIQKKIAGSLLTQLLRYPESLIVPDFHPPLTATMLNLNISLSMVFTGPLTRPEKQVGHNKKYLVAGQLEKHIKPIVGNKAIYGSEVKNFKAYYRDAELVITHAGHSIIMEALSFGKPLLCITAKKHPERYNNAVMLQKNDVGIVLEEKLVSRESILSAIEYAKTLNKERLKLYKDAAKKLNPIKTFEEIFASLKI